MGTLLKGIVTRHVRRLEVVLTSTIMTSQEDDYDKLPKEEREARNKADREREEAEQAGIYFLSTVDSLCLVSLSDHPLSTPQLCLTNGSSCLLRLISRFLFQRELVEETST